MTQEQHIQTLYAAVKQLSLCVVELADREQERIWGREILDDDRQYLSNRVTQITKSCSAVETLCDLVLRKPDQSRRNAVANTANSAP